MINYDDWDPRARRRRSARRRSSRWYLAVAAALLVVIGAFAIGRSYLHRGSGKSSSPATVSSTATSDTSPAGLMSLGACIDPTLSIVPSFAPSIRRDLGQAVGSLAPPTGAIGTDVASKPQMSVSLTVREVDTNSFSSDPGPYAGEVAVPGVPGLVHARPDPSAANYDSLLRAWSQGYQAVTTARRAAAAAAAKAARVIKRMPLDQNPQSNSGITACVSALLLTVPAGGQHSYLLASDLEENVAPQLAGSFRHAPLIIVQTCDSGNETDCQALLRRFLTNMRRLDVGPVTVIRPENADQAIRQWMHTGEVTS